MKNKSFVIFTIDRDSKSIDKFISLLKTCKVERIFGEK